MRPNSPLLWTPEAWAHVLPRRAHGVRLPLPESSTARAEIHALYKLQRDGIVQGATHADPEHAALQQKAITHLDTLLDSADAGPDASAAAAAALLVLFELDPRSGHTHQSLSQMFVAAWIEQGGPALAVLACATTAAFRARRDPRDKSIVLDRWVTMKDLYGTVSDPLERRWTALRERLATMPDAAYEAARAAAAKLRGSASPRLAVRLAFAFPDESEWSAELARTLLAGPGHDSFAAILCSLSDRALVEQIVAHFHEGAYELASSAHDLADALQLDAASALIAIAESAASLHWGAETERRTSAAALALVPTAEVAAWLAARLDDKAVRPHATAFFMRVPRLAVAILAPSVARARKGNEYAAALLASVVRAASDEACAAASELEGASARLVRDILARTAVVAEAEPSALPTVLAAPPWASAAKRPKKKKPTTLLLAPLPFTDTLDSTLAATAPAMDPTNGEDAARLKDLELRVAQGQRLFLSQLSGLAISTALGVLGRLPTTAWYDSYSFGHDVMQQLGRLGPPAIEPLLRFAKAKPGELAAGLEAAISPRVAPVMAHVLVRVRKSRRVAERWLTRHPRPAAIGLLPELLGDDARARANAGRALRFLASRGKRSVLMEVATEYGAACAAALEDALETDSLIDGAPTKPPKLSSWFLAASLPRPRLAGEPPRSLPLEAVQRLAEMLAFADPDEPYEGIEHVREACDPTSLGDFAWGIFEAWSLAGHPMDEKWGFFAIGHLGQDEHAHRVAALVRAWPSEGAFPRAVVGLDVLATMKSDVAFMLLHGIAEKVKSRPLQKKAREKMESVAESLGLGTEELADRLVPTLGLDDDGSRVLDFGARTFRVGFDEHLQPFVRDASGARLAELPKPAKADDEERATSATTEWKAIKKAAKVAGAQQVDRLQSAMIAQRRWESATFSTYLVRHPLVSHLVRRLVFAAYDASGARLATFRVAEDGSYADAEDAAFEVPEGARIGVLHPLELSVPELERWGERLSEYEVLQPFLQVGREVPRDVTRTDLEHFKAVDSLKLLGLERRGWRRGAVGDGGIIGHFEKEVGPLRVSLQLEPGLYAGDPKMNPTQRPTALDLTNATPIFLAEIAADLQAVGALTSSP